MHSRTSPATTAPTNSGPLPVNAQRVTNVSSAKPSPRTNELVPKNLTESAILPSSCCGVWLSGGHRSGNRTAESTSVMRPSGQKNTHACEWA
jgi:hypothetical protein